MTGRLVVGCSGWSYDDWTGPFYPADLPARRRLEHYASQFGSVEVNSTHYGTPSAATVEGWRAAAPDDFVFCVKLHRFGTHRKKLLDPESWAPRSLEPVRGLGSRAGPVLLQLPPRWKPRLDRLDAALSTLRGLGSRPVAVEVRDERWLGAELDEVLDRHRAVLCHHDLVRGLMTTAALRTPAAGFVYLRFHGPDPDHPYHGSYPAATLGRVARRCAELQRDEVDVFAFFNNDVGAAAPVDAKRFAAAARSAAVVSGPDGPTDPRPARSPSTGCAPPAAPIGSRGA